MSELIGAVQRSVNDVRAHGHEVARIRIHPLDAETIIAARVPAAARENLHALFGYPVVLDDTVRLGEPVAEMEETE